MFYSTSTQVLIQRALACVHTHTHALWTTTLYTSTGHHSSLISRNGPGLFEALGILLWMFMTPKFMCETLTPRVMVFGGKALGRS